MPWQMILEVALKALGFILSRVDQENKSRTAFLDFVASIEKLGLISAKLKMQHEDRLATLAEKRKNAQDSEGNG